MAGLPPFENTGLPVSDDNRWVYSRWELFASHYLDNANSPAGGFFLFYFFFFIIILAASYVLTEGWERDGTNVLWKPWLAGPGEMAGSSYKGAILSFPARFWKKLINGGWISDRSVHHRDDVHAYFGSPKTPCC